MYLNTSRQPPNLLPSCLIVVTPIIVLKELCSFPKAPRTSRVPGEGRCFKGGTLGFGALWTSARFLNGYHKLEQAPWLIQA